MLSSALDTSPPYLGRAGPRRLSKKGRREGEGRGEACLPARSGAVRAAWRPRPAALPERRGLGHASCCPDVRVACPWGGTGLQTASSAASVAEDGRERQEGRLHPACYEKEV